MRYGICMRDRMHVYSRHKHAMYSCMQITRDQSERNGIICAAIGQVCSSLAEPFTRD